MTREIPMLFAEEMVRALLSGRKSADEYWAWWLDRDAPSLSDASPVLFEDNPEIADAESVAGDASTNDTKEGAGKDETK